MKRQINWHYRIENLLPSPSDFKVWKQALSATLYTLKFNDSINAYNTSHFTPATVGYDAYVYLERFVI